MMITQEINNEIIIEQAKEYKDAQDDANFETWYTEALSFNALEFIRDKELKAEFKAWCKEEWERIKEE